MHNDTMKPAMVRVMARAAAFLVTTLIAGMAWAPLSYAQDNAAANSEKIQIRFTWQFKGEHAPLFVALDKGYYADEGLDVQLAEGSGAETVVRVVGQGIDKIGFGPATTVAEAIGNGLPIQVVAVYQPKTPIGLMSFPEVPLKSPKDIEGKTLGLTANESFAHLWEPFAKLNGVDLSKVTKVVLDYSARNGLFMSRKIDIQSTFLNVDVPLMEKKTGIAFNTMKVSDFGLELLGGGLFVNNEYANAHPETLRKLLRATAKGYRAAREDPKGAVASLSKYLRVKLPEDILEEQLKITLADTPMTSDKPLGWQDPAEWRSNIALLRQIGVVKAGKEPTDYYTNQYLASARESPGQ
jgi:NitT/TauT family transport system substrate-binding protein